MGTCGKDSCEEKRKVKPIVLNETETAILQCKICRDKIKSYISRLSNREAKLKQKAKDLLKSKDKERAKLYLRQCKLHKVQIETSQGQLDMIETQIINIEKTQNLIECKRSLEKGNAVLRQLQSEIKLEEWEKVRDDLEELKEKDKEIAEFMKGYGQEKFDEDVNKELEKMMNEIGGNNINLPNVPTEEIQEGNNNVKIKDKKLKIAA